MTTSRKANMLRVIIISLFLVAAGPLTGNARLYLQTEITIGTVAGIQDNAITLKTGDTYYPARPDIPLAVEVGAPVTIRFFTDAEQKNRYIQVAEGEYSLPAAPMPEQSSAKFK